MNCRKNKHWRELFVVVVSLVKIQLANQLHANPYLAKPGEAPVTVYLSTCAVTGGFMHIYTALDQNIFEKYVINVKHVVIRGGTNVNLAALGSGEVQFLSCAADSTTGAIPVGRDARLILSPRTIEEVRDTNYAASFIFADLNRNRWEIDSSHA